MYRSFRNIQTSIVKADSTPCVPFIYTYTHKKRYPNRISLF
nr:MAG TPA: Putative golgin subfamily A member 2-like protein 5 [Caudoviricetes sp.]